MFQSYTFYLKFLNN